MEAICTTITGRTKIITRVVTMEAVVTHSKDMVVDAITTTTIKIEEAINMGAEETMITTIITIIIIVEDTDNHFCLNLFVCVTF